MRKFLSFLILLLCTGMSARAEGETAYAVWCSANSTLYFTYTADAITAGGTFTPADGSGAQTVTNVWSGTAVTASSSTPAWNSTTVTAISPRHELIVLIIQFSVVSFQLSVTSANT